MSHPARILPGHHLYAPIEAALRRERNGDIEQALADEGAWRKLVAPVKAPYLRSEIL